MHMSDKRVLTIADHLGSVGGTESAQLAIFQNLAERGWAVDLLYVSQGDYWSEWKALATTTTQIQASIPTRSSPAASSIGSISGAISGMRVSPSVVYVHNAGDVPIGLTIGVAARAPVVAHLHLPPPFRQPRWLNALIRRTSAVIVPSSDAAERWTTLAGLDPARVSVIPTGIDTDRFIPLGVDKRMAVRARISVGDEESMILFVGRLERIKGAHFLIDAVRRLSIPTHVVLCGTTKPSAYVAELHDAADGRRVTFLGHRSDVPDLMAAADLLVVPSNCFETQGLVVSEAMASGIPVVASDIGGLGATMRGFPEHLVPPGYPARLGAAIESCVNWRNKDPELGPRSRAWVEEHMSLSQTIVAVDEVITAARRDRSRAGPFRFPDHRPLPAAEPNPRAESGVSRARRRRSATWGASRPPIGALWGWAQVALARNATDTLVRGTALVLSPHPDDETIGCGLLLAQMARRGHSTSVALATDGGGGWYSATPRPTPDGIVEIRNGEWHRALDALDVPKESRFEFGFADGTLCDHEGEVAGRIGDLLLSLSPSQVFVTKPYDPHPDHQTLARATRRAVIDVYGSRPRPGPDRGREPIHGDHPNGSPPDVYTYRVYPGEGLWPDGHPPRATLVMTLLQLTRSVCGLLGRRPLILRAARSRSDKTAAIEAYESQRKLLDGELRYVWRSGVELYRPMNMRSDPSSAPDRKLD
jgi:glycosyltransferase involved in cell wall biosynthesis/LmbE family N-acetylglucosaminyl deacetylase